LTADSTLGGKKCIKSTTSGSHSSEASSSNANEDDDDDDDTQVANYEIVEHLGTATLNYCSAFGLIYHKILPPPPALEGNDDTASAAMGGRKKRKRSSPPSNAAAAALSPDESSDAAIKTEKNGQETVAVQLSYDMKDLTADE
jgi:hypothetical protein